MLRVRDPSLNKIGVRFTRKYLGIPWDMLNIEEYRGVERAY